MIFVVNNVEKVQEEETNWQKRNVHISIQHLIRNH